MLILYYTILYDTISYHTIRYYTIPYFVFGAPTFASCEASFLVDLVASGIDPALTWLQKAGFERLDVEPRLQILYACVYTVYVYIYIHKYIKA